MTAGKNKGLKGVILKTWLFRKYYVWLENLERLEENKSIETHKKKRNKG